MRKRSELFFNLILIPLDTLMLLTSWVLAFIIRVEYTFKPTVYQVPGRSFVTVLLFLTPVAILIFALTGLYRFDSTRSRWREYTRVLIATSATTMFLIIVDFFTSKPLFPSKAVVIYGYVLASLSIIGMRFVLNLFQRWLFRFNVGRRQVVVVGGGSVADELTYSLQRNRGYKVVATITQSNEILKRLRAVFKRRHVDEIILTDDKVKPDEQADLIRLAHSYHAVYKFVPTIAGLFQTRPQTSLLSDFPLIEIVRTPLDGWWRIYKTVFDYLGAITLTFILSPLFLLLIVLIKLTDKGPAFYRHRRIGRNGKIVEVWKFRSMYSRYSNTDRTVKSILVELGGEKLWQEFRVEQKLKNDPRVTPVGRWLRRSSLDELPQLVNVLRGELSLIGPRPVTPEELDRYGESASTFLLIKPGMTGLWQVSGRNDVSYKERVKLDLFYVENWSARMDIRILLRTVIVVLFRKGY